MIFLATAGTCVLAVIVAAIFAMLLVALVTPANSEVAGDVASRRAGIIMLGVALVTLSIFLGLAVFHLAN